MDRWYKHTFSFFLSPWWTANTFRFGGGVRETVTILSLKETTILSPQTGHDVFLFFCKVATDPLTQSCASRSREFVLQWFKHHSGNQNRLILVGLCPFHPPAVAFSLVPNMSLHLRAHANSSLSLALSLSLARSFAGSRALCAGSAVALPSPGTCPSKFFLPRGCLSGADGGAGASIQDLLKHQMKTTMLPPNLTLQAFSTSKTPGKVHLSSEHVGALKS